MKAIWHLVPQEETRGKEKVSVLVKRLRGFQTTKNVNGAQVKQTIPIKDLMFKALVDTDGESPDFMMPREIVFSQNWVSKEDGTVYVGGVKVDTETGKTVRTTPNLSLYYLRNKVNVKTVQRRYFKEERTGKRCTTKVTQRIAVDEHTTGANQDADGDWWVKFEINVVPFELNDKDMNNQWGSMMLYLEDTFGSDVANTFGETLYERVANKS